MSRIFDDVFFSGFDCAMDGGNLSDNPYDAKEYRAVWIDGFNNGLKELQYLETAE